MTDDRIALRELLEKGSDATFLREMISPRGARSDGSAHPGQVARRREAGGPGAAGPGPRNNAGCGYIGTS